MSYSTDAIEQQIPYYLTKPQREGLQRALRDFQQLKPVQYYDSKYPNDLLQGDGWSGLDILKFRTGERDCITGMVLSNSCDNDLSNVKALPTPNLVFSPLLRLSRLVDLLREKGAEEERIQSNLRDIKRQAISNIFFLPKGGSLDDDYVVFFDAVYHIPIRHFQSKPDTERKKLFSLSMVGFYLLLLKISVHFCRFHEEVERAV